MSIDLRGMTPLIQVFDMATSLTFYCNVLGFDIVQTDSNTVACASCPDFPRSYCSFAYSAFACFRIGMSGSASFQRFVGK